MSYKKDMNKGIKQVLWEAQHTPKASALQGHFAPVEALANHDPLVNKEGQRGPGFASAVAGVRLTRKSAEALARKRKAMA